MPDILNNGHNYSLLSLILSVEEVTRIEYVQQFGLQNLMDDPVTAVAERIGKIDVNIAILDSEIIKTNDKLSIEVFDSNSHVITIKSTTTYAESLSMGGDVESPYKGLFFLSITDSQVLASLRLEETSTFYLIKYNKHTQDHYLFQADIGLFDYFVEEDLNITNEDN